MPNTELLNRTLNYIEAHLDEWDQEYWARRTSCGTSYCFAGTAVVLSGLPLAWHDAGEDDYGVDADELAHNVIDEGEVGDSIATTARNLLELTADQADRLFYPGNNLAKLHSLVAEFTAAEPALDATAGA